VASVRLSAGQDLFVEDDQRLLPSERVKELGGLKVNVAKSSLGGGPNRDQKIFTISPSSNPKLCLDYATGHGGSRLQLWECSGNENQLFYFNPGSYDITWGGDSTLCIDAGSNPAKAGSWLAMFPCKGYPQQKWGYDSNTESIYLYDSVTDASLCMDMQGGNIALGTPVQVWGCNHLAGQKWNLLHGITIRPEAGQEFCLDLYGGSTTNGNKVQLWRCNGLANQKWIFDDYRIRPINDPNKCVDGGAGLQGGFGLIIWDCNGAKQQIFGYDSSNMRTIYLTQSGAADASLCLDVAGGTMSEGAVIQTWSCNQCWNQQWKVIGPQSHSMQASAPTYEDGIAVRRFQNFTRAPSDGTGFLAQKTDASIQNPPDGGCPPRQHNPPVPAPGPLAKPGWGVEGHCETGSNYGFPVFYKYSDLNGSPWGAYYHMIYGEVPTTGYPICPYMLFLLYKPLLSLAGVQLPQAISTKCPTNAGTPFAKMSGFPATDWTWIYNPLLGRPQGDYVPKDTWIEVMHTAFSMDGSATWFYYTPGSGIYTWTGTTFAYNDHPDAVKDLLNGAACSDPPGQIGNNECQNNFEDMYKAAIKKGANTIQFKKHSDMQCDLNNNNDQRNMAIEVVDLGGPGMTTCSGESGKTRFRAGWQAKYVCVCDNGQDSINCEGFAMNR